MEFRALDLTIISAMDLNNVNLFGKMKVYAVASLSNDLRTRQRTPVDKAGGKNPKWNHTLKFSIPTVVYTDGLVLQIQLVADRFFRHRQIGEVHIPIKELLGNSPASSNGKSVSTQFVSYQVRKPNGKPKGVLDLSYKLTEKVVAPTPAAPKGGEFIALYPVGMDQGTSGLYQAPPQVAHPYRPPAGYGYGAAPPLPHGYGYGYPPQPQKTMNGGYGYRPQPPQTGYGGYVYQPQAVNQPAKKSRFGMGLGAGLMGGALGGLLIGDMISDAGDVGYDAGFDDAGGFDF